MKKYLPNKEFFLEKPIPEYPGFIIREYIKSGCNALVFRAYNDNLKKDLACKVIPASNLRAGALDSGEWYKEAQKANIIDSRAVVRCQHGAKWVDHAHDINCVVLCFDFIKGPSLREFIEKNKKNISIHFIEELLKTLFELLHEMQGRNMQHEDLHAGNILVELQTKYQLKQQIAFRVTDFGVGKTTDCVDLKDDFEQVALILKELLQNVNYQEASARDKYAFNILNNEFLARHLVEKDRTIDPNARNPERLYTRIEEIDTEFDRRVGATELTALITPFDYLSCEQIGEAHSVLKSLYSDQFLGLPLIESKNNVVLTGPRGCGKSTVFKSLSLWHRVLVNDTSSKDCAYVGIYYSCHDLYFAFPRYTTPLRKEAIDLPIHFITATLLIEILKTISKWAGRFFETEFRDREEAVSRNTWEILKLNPPMEPGSNSFQGIMNRLLKERVRAASKQRFANDEKHKFNYYFGVDILSKISEHLIKSFSFLDGRSFYLFIDDYSEPKITADLQKNLNRLLMQRMWSCFFKLSTESPVSFSPRDVDNKIYVEGREFSLLNLGLEYLNEDRALKLKFIEDVFGRRLKAVSSYPVSSLQELVGENKEVNYNKTALRIREHKKQEVWGKESLADLCSGDIHYIIHLVGRMVSENGGRESLMKQDVPPRIPIKLQNKIIRDEAGNFLNSLRGSFEYGDQLVEIVTAFGNVAYSFLMHKNSTNEEGEPPHQASRIEPYDELELSDITYKIYRELQRYSVFIEDRRGKSRRGKVVPRLWLRRFLIPHFNLTFSKRDSISLENDDVRLLFEKPKEFERKFRLKDKAAPDGIQGELFNA